MTPQEKAKELIERFKTVRVLGLCSEDPEVDAKQCALICVEEIMKEVAYINEGVQSIDWLTVKSEIEKL